MSEKGERNAISNWRSNLCEILLVLRPFFLSWICLSLSLAVQVSSGRLTLPRLEPILPHSFSVSFSLGGQSTVSWGLTPRHWPLPFIGSFSSFDSDSLSPPSEIRGGGKEGMWGKKPWKIKGSRVCGGKMRKRKREKEREARAAELWSVERRVFSCGILFNRPLTAIPTILSVDGSSHFAEITPSFWQWHQDLSKSRRHSIYRYFCAPVPFVRYFPCDHKPWLRFIRSACHRHYQRMPKIKRIL